MARKIRVYELARELGLTNKEGLDLLISMGIGVKSHSSSIEEAQADRVRRRAERDGLKRTPPPEPKAPERAPTEASQAGAPGRPGATAGGERLAGDNRSTVAFEDGRSRPHAGTAGHGAGSLTPPPGVLARPGEGPGQAPATTTSAAGHAPRASAPVGTPAASTPDASALARHPGSSPGTATEPGPAAPAAARPSPPPGVAHPREVQRPTGHRAGQPRPPGAVYGPPSAGAQQTSEVLPGEPSREVGAGQLGSSSVPPQVGQPATSQQPGAHQQVEGPPASSTGGAGGRLGGAGVGGAGQGGAGVGSAGVGGAGQSRLRRGPVSPITGKPIPPPPGFRRPVPPAPGRPEGSRPPGTEGRPGATFSPGGGQFGDRAPRPSRGTGGGSSQRAGGPPGSRTSGPGSRSTGSGPLGRTTGARPGAPRPNLGGRAPDATYRQPTPPPGPYRGGPAGAPMRGRPGGGPGGPGGGRGGARPSRRSRSRRASREELEAQAPTTYTPSTAPVPEGEVIVERGATAQELGPRLNRSAADVVRFLMSQGEMVTATQSLSDDMIELFAAEIGAKVRLVDPGEQKEAELQARYFAAEDEEEEESRLRPRPPVVTVMGHVDHGKTTLLDKIREANVAAGEAGGITQHIGAYQTVAPGGLPITFIDTPGHEAFTSMRARGAEVTDIVVLVVAADDGVMPQTVEAINHAKAAGVPVVVAINKVDRADADPNRVMQQLADLGLVPERWGGDTIMVEVSALQNLGIDDLLEQLQVVAEVEELRANPDARARGVVLEANLDPGKGPVATVIVQNGTLRVGDHVVAGAAWGRVKALIDDKGDNIKEAPPSFPAQVLGFGSVPQAGDELRAVPSSRMARDIAEQRAQRSRSADLRRSSAATSGGAKLEDIFEQIQRGEAATLNLIVKADTQGSLEAVTESLRKLERDDVKLSFVHRAVGGVTENDVALAAASNATIIGFNVRPGREARATAEVQGVEIRTYEIIYKLIEDVQAAIVGMLAPEYEEVVTGEAEVREIFRVPRVGLVAGCYVTHGVITRGSKVRFLRDGVILWKGTVTSLRRFKEDVREVHEGFECGVGLSNNQDLQSGDVIETYEEREVPRS